MDGGPSDTSKVIVDQDIKRFYEAGILMNFYRGPPGNHKLHIQSALAYGDYEGLQGLPMKRTPSGPVPDKRTSHRFIGRLRIFPNGLDMIFGRQVSLTPMFGFELNAGHGPDPIKFFTGVAVNVKSIRDAEEVVSGGGQSEGSSEKKP